MLSILAIMTRTAINIRVHIFVGTQVSDYFIIPLHEYIERDKIIRVHGKFFKAIKHVTNTMIFYSKISFWHKIDMNLFIFF